LAGAMQAVMLPAVLGLFSSPLTSSVVSNSPTYAAALFDFDGTLAQSEDTHRKTFAEVLGQEWDMEFWESNCVGHAPPDIIRRFRKPDAQHSIEEMLDLRARLFEDCIERGELPLTGGTRELLHALRDNGVRCAVVTSGPRSYIEKALNKLEIADCFEVVVTGTDEALQGRLKPDPYPFLYAADLMGVDAQDCLAFEDSTTGISSAVGAGMDTVVVAANVNAHLEAGVSPGIIARVPCFTDVQVPHLIRRADTGYGI